MDKYIEQIVLQRMKLVTYDELMSYSKAYNFSLTKDEGLAIIRYLQRDDINPFSSTERQKIFSDLAEITDKKTAKQAKRLFENIIRENRLEHLFN